MQDEYQLTEDFDFTNIGEVNVSSKSQSFNYTCATTVIIILLIL